jgi:hypothetical membrane protein
MNSGNRKVAGALLFFGGLEPVILIMIAEALYPGYSIADNYISDLGVGSSALVFNSSMVILGVAALIGSYFMYREFKSPVFCGFLMLTGIGALGVGLFPEDTGLPHMVASMVTFLFAGLSALASYKLQKPPLSYFSVVLGVLTLVALGLFAAGIYGGLGVGGMERMIAYPPLLWGMGFGGFLMGSAE